MKNLILIGGGGHCASVIDAIESMETYQIAGILDTTGQALCGYPCLGGDELIPELVAQKMEFLITVGSIASSFLRVRLVKQVEAAGGTFAKIIASTARVAHYAKVGVGSVILHHALVNNLASVGPHCIINSFADIEHDVQLGAFSHVSTGCRINGGCRIGRECFIGSGTIIFQGISLPDHCVIGGGSVVRKSISLPGTYCGKSLEKIK